MSLISLALNFLISNKVKVEDIDAYARKDMLIVTTGSEVCYFKILKAFLIS